MAKTFPTAKQRRTHSDRNDALGARSDTIAARCVLRDCHAALAELRRAQSDQQRRILWVTVTTLLRTVGHVLSKVDGARSNELRTAIDTVWNDIQAGRGDHQIFHDFIERERNAILKEYNLFARRVRDLTETNGEIGILVGARILSPIETTREAIRWWERILESVEARALSAHQASRGC